MTLSSPPLDDRTFQDLVNLSDATKGGIPTQTMAVAFAREGDRFEFAPSFNTDVQPSGWPWETPSRPKPPPSPCWPRWCSRRRRSCR